MEEEYETTIGYSYHAKDPADAAKQFMDNLKYSPTWFVRVRNMQTDETFIVDTETGSIENE